MKQLIILVVLSCFSMSFAQQWAWAKTYTGSVAPLSGNCLGIDGNNNIYTASPIDTTGSVIIKTDPNGNEIWRQYLTGNTAIIDIEILNSQLYITGNFRNVMGISSNTFVSSGQLDIFLSAIDLNGNFIWTNTYGGANDELVSDMLVTHTGVYLCGAFSNSTTLGTYTAQGNGWQTAFFSRHDLVGNINLLKAATSNYTYSSSYIYKMDYVNGRITLVGNFVDHIGFDMLQYTCYTNNSLASRFVATISSLGTFTRLKGAPYYYNTYNSLKVKQDSSFLFAGYQSWTNGEEGRMIRFNSNCQNTHDYFLQQPCYADGTHFSDIALNGSESFSWGDMIRGSNCLPSNITNTLCLAKFNDTLKLLYMLKLPGTAKLRAASIKKQGNDFIVSGTIWNGGIKIGPDSLTATTPVIFLAKFSESISVGQKELESQPSVIEVFPNPSGGDVHIQLNSSAAINVEFRDQLGRLLISQSSSGDLHLKDLPKGFYIIQVIDSRKHSLTKKKLVVN